MINKKYFLILIGIILQIAVTLVAFNVQISEGVTRVLIVYIMILIVPLIIGALLKDIKMSAIYAIIGGICFSLAGNFLNFSMEAEVELTSVFVSAILGMVLLLVVSIIGTFVGKKFLPNFPKQEKLENKVQ